MFFTLENFELKRDKGIICTLKLSLNRLDSGKTLNPFVKQFRIHFESVIIDLLNACIALYNEGFYSGHLFIDESGNPSLFSVDAQMKEDDKGNLYFDELLIREGDKVKILARNVEMRTLNFFKDAVEIIELAFKLIERVYGSEVFTEKIPELKRRKQLFENFKEEILLKGL